MQSAYFAQKHLHTHDQCLMHRGLLVHLMFKVMNINFTTWRMYFENSTFGTIVSQSGCVGNLAGRIEVVSSSWVHCWWAVWYTAERKVDTEQPTGTTVPYR